MGRKSKTKSGKPIPRAAQADPPAEQMLAPRQRWTIPIGLVSLAVVVGVWWLRDSPESLYREAHAAFEVDRARCEQLLDQSLDRRGGDFPAAQILRCRLMGRSGQWIEALGYFSTIKEPSRAPGEELMALGIESHAAGNVVLARLAFDAAIEQSGETLPAALERLAVLEQELGNVDAARDLTDRLLGIDSNNAVALLVRARLTRADLDVNGAVEWYQRAVQHAPNADHQNIARRELIRVLLELGNASSAREYWEAFSTSATVSDDDRLLLADLLRLEGRPRESFEQIDSLSAEVRTSERALFLTGLARLDLEESQAAVDAFRKVLQYNPFYKEAHYKLAIAYQRLGNEADAETHFARAQKLTDDVLRIMEIYWLLGENPDQPAMTNELIQLYEQTGQHNRANTLRNETVQN